MLIITFTALGIPKGQPRPRAFARRFGAKVSARVYDPGTAEGWKGDVAIAARPHLPSAPITEPAAVYLNFYMPRPKSHYRTGKHAGVIRGDAPEYHTGKPDCDNLAKAVLDALTALGFWSDDALIWKLTVSKAYHERPGCEIRIESRGATA